MMGRGTADAGPGRRMETKQVGYRACLASVVDAT
jgi:hypothetical protein